MTYVAPQKPAQLANFAFAGSDNNAAPWLSELRFKAREEARRRGYPSNKEEAWRFTNIGPIAKASFRIAKGNNQTDVSPYSLGSDAAIELVFVNGHFSSRLSKIDRLPPEVTIGSLRDAIEAEHPIVQDTLAHYARFTVSPSSGTPGDGRGLSAKFEANPFVAFNTAFIHDGAFIHLPSHTEIDGPIHLLFVSTTTNGAGELIACSHPRVLVVAENHVTATLVESYVGAEGQTYFTNAVTEMVIGDECHIDHCKLNQESRSAFHVATMQVEVGRQTQFISQSATTGGKITRNDLNVSLNGEYAEATLNGLVVISGDQHCDNHTLLAHEKANCPSHELYKHVLDSHASGVFKGKIYVRQDAQKTDSKQTSKSLLLSDDASMNSQPALEIHADDVKCTHGSTIGPVDEEMVFYLRSRGVALEAARHLLTYAFAADVTRRIKVEPVRRRLEDFIASQHGLPLDLRITDLGAADDKAR